MTTKTSWAANYANWLQEQYQVTALDDADEITTPFTNSIGDDIQIFAVAQPDGSLELTDDGNTINDLQMMGINIHNPTRRQVIMGILEQYTVKLRDDELVVHGKVNNFPSMKQRLLQAILRIDDLSQTRRETVTSIYQQEVASFLRDNDFGGLPNYVLQGGTGNEYKVDYAIGETKVKPLRLMQVINKPGFQRVAAEGATFADIRSNQALHNSDIQFVVIFNDSERKVSQATSNIARQNAIELLPWSDKTELLALR